MLFRSHVCAWPDRLALDLNATGGRFTQRWQVFAESWIALPGDLEHWPSGVTLNNVAAAVVARAGQPQVRVGEGSFNLSGHFSWNRAPESLHIPAQAGIVALNVDGQAIARIERQNDALWLGKHRDAQTLQQIDVQVYRLLSDAVPADLTTRLRLQVGGEAREEQLSRLLPDGFVLMSLESALPARIEPDGTLRVQVRAGSWEINVHARAPSAAGKIAIPAAHGLWSKQEIWSFQADDRLRVAAVEGSEGIDPAQANVPPEWRRFPSFRLMPGAAIEVVERSRGLSLEDQDGNRLALQRQLYLDFDHQGFTFVDQLSGQMRSHWRLDLMKPYQLMSAEIAGDNLLITRGADANSTGIEVRTPQLMLSALGRLDESAVMPATGWSARFERVSGILNLPPGYRLLAVRHADSAPGAWIEQWGLLDLFLLLITTVLAFRARGAWFAAAAFGAVLLVYQEDNGFVWLLLWIMLAIVLLRVAPAGWPRTAAVWIRNGLMVSFLIALVPFAISQLRFALYPQLADQGGFYGRESVGNLRRDLKVAAPAPASQGDEAKDAMEQPTVASMGMANSSMAIANSKKWSAAPPPHSYNQRYAPSTLLQAGPGRPQWRFRSYPYSWNGPVDVAQSVQFIIIAPWLVALWRLLGVGLLGYLLLEGLRTGVDLRGDWRSLREWRQSQTGQNASAAGPTGTAGPTVLLALLMLCSLIAWSDARAASTPDPQLLNELRTRISEPPHCLPTCLEVLTARVGATPESLEVDLQVSALATVALPLPNAAHGLELEGVTLDGASPGVYRDSNGVSFIALRSGVHSVVIKGRPATESLELNFAQVPRVISVNATGWNVTGITDGRMIANTLELVRHHQAGESASLEKSAQAAPYVRVHRHVRLDLDWSVTTTVERLSPAHGGFSLTIPVLKDESVLTDGIDTQNGRGVLVGFDSSALQFMWQSALRPVDAINLTAPRDVPWVEVWSFDISPLWSVQFQGLPAVTPQNVDPASWSFEYYPRPGESLALQVSRPMAVKGETLAIDSVSLTTLLGRRSSDATLGLTYRSTQGGRHAIHLPSGARVNTVTLDATVVPIRPDKDELPLAILPGEHRLEVSWQQGDAAAWKVTGPALDLHSASSNITTIVRLPADRWILFAGGDGVGPVILYWGELLAFTVLAVLLGRSRHSPLRVHEWLLLGLGLSTFSWTALVLFAAWLFAMRWRQYYDSSALSDSRFKAMQVALWLLSVIAGFSLIATFRTALLASPDMRIVGAGQSVEQLSWFVDKSAGALPHVWVISISMWWYKLAMLAWTLWLAFALARWGRIAWNALGRQGWWRSASTAPTVLRPADLT